MNVGTKNQATRDARIMSKLRELREGLSIIDVGAGEMPYKKYCEHLKYTSQDFCQYDNAGDNKGLQHQKWDTSGIDIISDITEIPVKDEQYDAACCFEVIEHVSIPIDVIREIHRILKKTGILLITAPFCSLVHQSPYYYYSGFPINWYDKILQEAGFEIIERDYNGNYFEFIAQELIRLKSIAKKYIDANCDYSYLESDVRSMLKYLEEYSEKDKNSQELLCFGWHIRAVKK